MSISAGKYWGMRRMADATGRFRMTAVDQRPPIKNPIRAKRGTPQAPWEDVAGFKELLIRELQAESSAMLLDPHHAEVGNQGRERVVRDFRAGRGNGAYQGRLARIGVADQSDHRRPLAATLAAARTTGTHRL